MDLYTHIQANQRKLNPAETELLLRILSDKSLVEKTTIRQLAERNFVSPNTIERMCKKLDFSGFSAFKFAYIKFDPYKPDGFAGLTPKETILETDKMLLERQMRAAVEIVAKANKVAVFSGGLGRFAALELEERLRLIHKKSHAFFENDLKLHSAKRMAQNDCVLVFDINGTEDVALLQVAHGNGASIIVFTSGQSERFSGVAEHIFHARTAPRKLDILDITDYNTEYCSHPRTYFCFSRTSHVPARASFPGWQELLPCLPGRNHTLLR